MTDNNFYSENQKDFEKDENINVFVMMRYEPNLPFVEIEETIKETLQKFGLKAILARNLTFHRQLWSNVRFCMEHSRYAIVVFENIVQPEFNPNVALELGYILALKKPYLILKEKSVPILHSNIRGFLHSSFDSHRVKETVGAAIEDWLHMLKHTKIEPAWTITANTQLEANIERTDKIVADLLAVSAYTDANNTPLIIRQEASLSSLAISNNEQHAGDVEKILKTLFLDERNRLETLLQDGAMVRLIISPNIPIERLQRQLVKPEFIEANILPRYERLISTISNNSRNSNLQVVYTHRLSHANLLIIGEKRTFIGRTRLRQIGFPQTTVISDPAVIQGHAYEFDIDFKEAAADILQVDEPTEDDFGSELLKQKVVEYLKGCQRRVKRMLTRYPPKI